VYADPVRFLSLAVIVLLSSRAEAARTKPAEALHKEGLRQFERSRFDDAAKSFAKELEGLLCRDRYQLGVGDGWLRRARRHAGLNARAGWDDAAEAEVKSYGVSPAVAKALLAMNPALRDQGLDTMKVVRQSQEASAGKRPATVSRTPTEATGIYENFKKLALKDFDKLLALVGFKTAEYVNQHRKKR